MERNSRYRKKEDTKLLEVTEKFNAIFVEISDISYNFIRDLNQGDVSNFEKIFKNYNEKVSRSEEEIPKLTKQIREFGIF